MRNIIAFICLSLIGLALLPFVTVRLVPSGTLPEISISYSMPGHSSTVIEKEVTSRLEAAVERVRGVSGVRSLTDNGGGRISISIDKHADADAVRFEVSARIRQIWGQLPEEVSYPYISMSHADDEATSPFLVYSIDAPVSAIDIQEYAEDNILPKLSRIKGIDKTEISGATPVISQLEYDQQQLSTIGVTEDQIAEAVGHEDNMIRTSDKRLVFIDRLVNRTQVEDTPTTYFRINGQPSVFLSMTAEKTANQLVVGKSIKQQMDEIIELLPEGYEMHIAYDSTEDIGKQLQMVVGRSWLTIAILLLFVAIVYRSIRYVVMMTLCLSANLLIAVILYYVLRLEIQIYSLAGITISLNLIIDNMILMADHIRRKGHDVISAEMTATLTTIGALSVIFFLSDEQKLTLADFAWVIIVNLACSLLVAFCLVPPMMRIMGIDNQKKKTRTKLLRYRGKLSVVYEKAILLFLSRRIFVVLLLCIVLGLTAWKFADEVREGTYYQQQKGETVLYASASLPNGATIGEMNSLIQKMERYLSGFQELSIFQTNIYDARHATIAIHFKPEYQKGGFPYTMKSKIVSKALTLGGGAWNVYGLSDQGFSNDVRETAGTFEIKMMGYNYDELWKQANVMKDTLLRRKRIRDVNIGAEYSPWKEDYNEYVLLLENWRLAQLGMTPTQFFSQVYPLFIHSTEFVRKDGNRIRLKSKQGKENDVWALMNIPVNSGNRFFKVSDVATLDKQPVPKRIIKENQQYQLVLQYDYIGASEMGRKYRDVDIEKVRPVLPMGYTIAAEESWKRWSPKDKETYWLVALSVLIIWFMMAVSFNSLRQPFSIIFVIPISFIGVFLAFILFNMKIDEGFLASLIFLTGITVNAGIFIVREYKAIRNLHPLYSPVRCYRKAFNNKIIPILLTQLSTFLGFIPFVIGSPESFWFNLAVGIMGGIVMSLIGIVILLPITLLKRID